jgi:urease accessory protein
MGRFDVLAIGIVRGPRLARDAAAIVAAASASPVQRGLRQLVAAAPIADGCVFRVAGQSVEDVTKTVRTQLAFVPALLGDDPWLRKW